MITTICAGDWLQFQQIQQGKLVTEQGRVKTSRSFPAWLWVGDCIVADSDGEQDEETIVLAHVSGDLTARIARAIADADGNSRPDCVYIKLAEAAKAAMAAGGAK